MSVKVKICGIRSQQSALAAINAGADFLGFNFVATSKRYIEPPLAIKITDEIKNRVKLVGVFQDAEASFVNQLAGQLGLDFVQLHGHEDTSYIKTINYPVIKAIGLSSTADLNELTLAIKRYEVDYVLLDRENQGVGKSIDTKKAKIIAKNFKIFLAGDLKPQNVAEAVANVRPYAVDVASGIESNGLEDVDKIEAFINKAKGVAI